MAAGNRIRIGSHKSPLAMAQARLASQALGRAEPGIEVEIVAIASEGDADQRTRLDRFSARGIFTRRLEEALLSGRIDAAVHSAKDLPSSLEPPFALAAALPREDAHDALVARTATFFMELKAGAAVGTCSPRRVAQLRRVRPDLAFLPVRGNIQTRLDRLDQEGFDALVLAAAGMKRLGMAARISELLPFDVCLPAAGQGVIVMECLAASQWRERLRAAGSEESLLCLAAERSFLRRLGAGCSAAVAAHAVPQGSSLLLRARVLDLDGAAVLEESAAAALGAEAAAREGEAAAAGERLAEALLGRGAAGLLDRSGPAAP